MTKDTKLEASLLLMRLAIAAFLLVWAVDKVVAPEHAQVVFSHFYF
jgi:putative oxidoreductase